jgi:rod shape-determining protein MreC
LAVYRRSARRRSIVILLVITSVTLITLDERGNGAGVIDSVRSGAHDVVAPVQRGVQDITRPVGDWIDGVTSRGSLETQNRKLRHEVESLRNQVGQAQDLEQQNEQLRHQLGLTFLGDLKTIGAQVISGASGNFETTVEIDQGTKRGVAKGMPVVSDRGLVGRVVEVSRSSATVLLITDPSSSVAVRLPRSRATGVASGQSGDDKLAVDFVNPDAKVKAHDPVVSAGQQDGLYPPGIPIGTIASVAKSPGANQYDITVKPAVDLSQLEFVQVVRWLPPAGTP